MLAYKIQTPGNYPEESIQHSEHSKFLNQELLTFVAGCCASEQFSTLHFGNNNI